MTVHEPGPDPAWRTLARRSLHRTPWLEVAQDDTINPGGQPKVYDHVLIPASVTVLARDDGRDLYAITRQWIYTHGETQWRLPAGGTDRQGSPPHRETAARELQEEVGATAARWSLLGKVHGADSVTNHVDYVWLAWDLTFGEQHLEPGEADLVVHWLPFDRLLTMALLGDLPHAGSSYAVLTHALLSGRRSPGPITTL